MSQDFFENVERSLKVFRKEITAVSELNDIKRDIDDVIENINSPLLVMVMGEFSRGKSTFINALVGQSIAMVDAKPTTAVITKLSYGEKDKITVFMRDGSVKDYDTDSFARLTAQGSDESNKLHKEIDYVERTLPIDMLKSMSIIDSPGLNSINDVHEEATKRFMDKADTVIWLFDANDPCKQTEIDALKRLNPRLAPLVLVNKIDVIDEDEGDSPEKVLAKIERDLTNNKLEYQKIIGVSAKMAFKGKINNNKKLIAESNINEFYDAVDTIILPNREKFKRISMVDELSRVFFAAGRLLNDKREENNKRKNKDYSVYIETEERLAGALDELENVADIVMTEIDSTQSTRRKRLNPAEKSFYGALYWHGLLAKKNRKVAQQYTEEAAVRGDAVAQMNLAEMYQELGQKDKAEYWFRRLGKARKIVENAESAYSKAKKYYENGKYTEAVKWYRKAVEAGNADAMYRLGEAYEDGEGVEEDEAEAVKWYREAVKGYRKAAEAGNADAMNSLGEAYRDGKGVEEDEAEAVEWYRKAAEAGNADAMNSLGDAYENGEGVEEDEAEAVKWYRKAAEAGDHAAGYHLAFLYMGQGNKAEAVKWYRKAAEAGDTDAMYRLGYAYENGEGVKEDEEEAVKWYRKAAEAGNAMAMDNLGYAYDTGEGVTTDKAEAEKWYRKAAEAGNAVAMKNLASLYKRQGNKAEALKWYTKAAGTGDEDAKKKAEEIKAVQRKTVSQPKPIIDDDYASPYDDPVATSDVWLGNELGEEINSSMSAEEIYRRADQYYHSSNYAKALAWYKRAADLGHAFAMKDIASMFKYGLGVMIDNNEAKKWTLKAAERMYWAGKACYDSRDYRNAIAWYEHSAASGNKDAMFALGNIYYWGCKDITANANIGMSWYKKAAAAGHRDALKKVRGW